MLQYLKYEILLLTMQHFTKFLEPQHESETSKSHRTSRIAQSPKQNFTSEITK